MVKCGLVIRMSVVLRRIELSDIMTERMVVPVREKSFAEIVIVVTSRL